MYWRFGATFRKGWHTLRKISSNMRQGLIELLKESGDFCIGGACYPEGHVETEHKNDDIINLKHKVDCGVDFSDHTDVFLIIPSCTTFCTGSGKRGSRFR